MERERMNELRKGNEIKINLNKRSEGFGEKGKKEHKFV
jgi:hypothetical protein